MIYSYPEVLQDIFHPNGVLTFSNRGIVIFQGTECLHATLGWGIT